MNDEDEAESSRAHAGPRHSRRDSSTSDAEPAPDRDDDALATEDAEEEARQHQQRAKERKVDARRKRMAFLDHLLRELDGVVLLELVLLYHLDCSFFWFAARAVVHVTLLTPLPDMQLARPNDEPRPFLPMILAPFAVNFLLHALSRAPSAGEETRGYLHGGLMIDFIGQQGPTSKWKLAALDLCILVLQLVMVAVHAKKRDVKFKLAAMSSGPGPSGTTTAEGEGPTAETTAEGENAGQSNLDTHPDQDADAEERGVLRRTDTLSDLGADADEEDVLLPSSSESRHVDALDVLQSGQGTVGEFTLIDTLVQEHQSYQTYRRTRSEATSSSSLSPSTLRQLHNIRMRFGVGGG